MLFNFWPLMESMQEERRRSDSAFEGSRTGGFSTPEGFAVLIGPNACDSSQLKRSRVPLFKPLKFRILFVL